MTDGNTTEKELLDSNILVYAYDKSEKEKNSICSNMLNRCFLGENVFYLSVQNISEFYRVVTEKIEVPMPSEDAKQTVEEVIVSLTFNIIKFDETTILEAIKISQEFNVHYWDALLAATMRQNGVFTIYTENDKDFKKIKWLKVKNPFKKIK